MELLQRFRSLIRTHRTETALLSGAIILRLAALLVFTLLSRVNGFDFPIVGSDAHGYVALAKLFPDSESFRTPLYPMFISLFESVWFVSIAQSILGGFIALLTYKIAHKYFGYAVALTAGILIAIDPIGLYLSSVILSETLFTFTLLLSIYYIDKFVLSGLLLGVATLIRPGALVLIPIFILFVAISKKKTVPTLIFTASVIIILLPWSVRNKMLFNSWNLSSVGIYNAFQYHTPAIYSIINNIPEDEARKIVYERAGNIDPRDLRNNPRLADTVFSFIGEAPLQYAGIYILKVIPFFITNGVTDVGRVTGIFDASTPNVTSMIMRGQFSRLMDTLRQTPFQTIIFVSGTLFWILITLLMAYGAHRKVGLFFLSIIIISALAAGTVSNARIRYPVTPFIFILAAYSVIQIVPKTRSRRALAQRV